MRGVARVVGLGLVAIGAVAGCREKQESAQRNAQGLAAVVAAAREKKGSGYCPSSDQLRTRGEAEGVGTVDPWGKAFVISCSSIMVTVRSFGPDGLEATSDDISATAVSSPASTVVPRAAAPDPPPAAKPPQSAACIQCDRTRITCLGAVAGGKRFEGSEAYADPENASKSECAFAYMGCKQEIFEKTGEKCRLMNE